MYTIHGRFLDRSTQLTVVISEEWQWDVDLLLFILYFSIELEATFLFVLKILKYT